MNKIHKKRLLNVARALREAAPARRKDGKFTMLKYGHWCGTPACALGHYTSRRDLQRTFRLTSYAQGPSSNPFLDAAKHFGLTEFEFYQLFGVYGCDNAKTPIQAARYIERFVARKERE